MGQSRSSETFRHLVRRLRTVGLLTLLVCALTWASIGPARQLMAGETLDYTAALGACTAAIAWLAVLWFVACLVLALLARLPGAVGRTAQRLAYRVTPTLIRHLVEASLGATLAIATTAHAAPIAAPVTPATTTTQPPVYGSAQRASDLANGTHQQTKPTPNAMTPPAAGQVTTPPIPNQRRTAPPPVAGLANGIDAGGSATTPKVPPPDRPVSKPPSRQHRKTDEPQVVVVRAGDTLWDIAARTLPGEPSPEAIAAAWPRWYAANRAVIGADPNVIHPGQHLRAPTP